MAAARRDPQAPSELTSWVLFSHDEPPAVALRGSAGALAGAHAWARADAATDVGAGTDVWAGPEAAATEGGATAGGAGAEIGAGSTGTGAPACAPRLGANSVFDHELRGISSQRSCY
jgi:hypothetical protein